MQSASDQLAVNIQQFISMLQYIFGGLSLIVAVFVGSQFWLSFTLLRASRKDKELFEEKFETINLRINDAIRTGVNTAFDNHLSTFDTVIVRHIEKLTKQAGRDFQERLILVEKVKQSIWDSASPNYAFSDHRSVMDFLNRFVADSDMLMRLISPYDKDVFTALGMLELRQDLFEKCRDILSALLNNLSSSKRFSTAPMKAKAREIAAKYNFSLSEPTGP